MIIFISHGHSGKGDCKNKRHSKRQKFVRTVHTGWAVKRKHLMPRPSFLIIHSNSVRDINVVTAEVHRMKMQFPVTCKHSWPSTCDDLIPWSLSVRWSAVEEIILRLFCPADRKLCQRRGRWPTCGQRAAQLCHCPTWGLKRAEVSICSLMGFEARARHSLPKGGLKNQDSQLTGSLLLFVGAVTQAVLMSQMCALLCC